MKHARNRKIVFDEDCPETTPERALRFKRVNPIIANETIELCEMRKTEVKS